MKSPREIDCLREAGQLSVAGLEAAIAAIRPGTTDNAIAAAGLAAMVQAGSEFCSIQPFVRTGPRAAVVHATYRRHPVAPGESIILEFGGTHRRYTAPVYGTAVIGPPPQRLRRLADVCLRTLDLLYETLKPGRTLDEVARVAACGLAGLEPDVEFGERHGYSVALGFPPDWVEHSLCIAEGEKRVLEPGMVFHTPRSLRVPDVTSAGLSETVLITDRGCELLTPHRRALVVV